MKHFIPIEMDGKMVECRIDTFKIVDGKVVNYQITYIGAAENHCNTATPIVFENGLLA